MALRGRQITAVTEERAPLQSVEKATQPLRRRLDWRGEVVLALLPTLTVLVVFGAVQAITSQRLLFASLASSAFLIYLDPRHATNSLRTLVLAHLSAAALGLLTATLLGHGFGSGALAMVATIAVMIAFDLIHPPAVSTALAFAVRSGADTNLTLFALAIAITAWLVVLEQVMVRILARLER